MKNKESTMQILLQAVDDIITEDGFEYVGVNAVAAKAGVSKMLIYRYFDSLEGLIAAYIKQHDFWINFDVEIPEGGDIGYYVKEMFHTQIRLLRENYTLRRLYRWELTSNNAFVKEIREVREKKGYELVKKFSRVTGIPEKEMAIPATLISAGISYLVLLEENCETYNGIPLQTHEGWSELEEGINVLVERWLNK